MSSTYSRRQFLGHSAAAAGGVVAAGAIADLAESTPAGAVTTGGTLTVGILDEPTLPFNPDYGHMDQTGFNMARTMYDPLCVVSSDGKTVYPYLCESITPNKTYNEWTIKARTGVKFHDGSTCNAQAIYANLEADHTSYLTGTAVDSLIKGFSLDAAAQTVTVHTKYKWVTFPYTLAEQQISFMAQAGTLGSSYGGNPIGTGPFIFDSWDSSSGLTVKANPNYWRGPGTYPYLNQIDFTVIGDSGARFDALVDGACDLIIEDEGPALTSLRGLSKTAYSVEIDYPGTPPYAPGCNCIMLNLSTAPFNNINMRKGCAMAIDQALYVSVVDPGESVPIDGIFLKGSPYYKNPGYPKYNLAGAKALIKKVPAADRKFKLQWAAPDPTVETAANFIAGQLAKVGVTVTLDPILTGGIIDNAITGAYQAMTWSDFGGVAPELNYPWFSTETYNKLLGLDLNFPRNNDPKIQSLMIAGMAATATKARESAWAAVNAQLNKDLPFWWTDRAAIGVAASSKVQNWKTAKDPAGHPVLCPNQGVLFFNEIWKS